MRQFTFRLNESQVDRFDHIKKNCVYKSSQAAFEAMVDNYQNYYEDYPMLIAENKRLISDLVNISQKHDEQINMLMRLIIKITSPDNVLSQPEVEY